MLSRKGATLLERPHSAHSTAQSRYGSRAFEVDMEPARRTRKLLLNQTADIRTYA
jgi:hypothetical protein